MMLLCISNNVIEIYKIKRLLMKAVLLKYSLLHRESKLSSLPVEKWIRRSSLSLKELTSLCMISALLSGAAIWVSSFQDVQAITFLLPILPIKGHKNGTKILAMGYHSHNA